MCRAHEAGRSSARLFFLKSLRGRFTLGLHQRNRGTGIAAQSRQKPERPNVRVVGTVLLWIVLALSQGCRGIGDLLSNFKPDFELTITPDSVTLDTTSIDDLPDR